tara:strand:+ start:5132 stop:6028 length:897 start_codon:yes stop_codon:yes gene_type:complete
LTINKRKYLQPEIVASIENISLRARLVVEGFLTGLHKSPYHGFSVEFAEHRSYGPGDELKHLDWKLYGKTDRYYIKQYEEETNLLSYILLDISKSMTYASHEIAKVDYGSYLASALSYLMLKQRDAVSLTLFDEKTRGYVPPHSTQSHLNLILEKLDNIEPGNDTKISPTLHELAEKIKKRGLVILISDLLDEPEQVLAGLKHFRHKKHEVIVFHLIDPKEQDLSFSIRTRFYDIETGEKITTEPWQIRKAYKKVLENFQSNYAKEMRKRNIDYIPIITNQPLDIVLNHYLEKRKKIS